MDVKLFSTATDDIASLTMGQIASELQVRHIELPDSKKLAIKALLNDNQLKHSENSLQLYIQDHTHSNFMSKEIADNKSNLTLLQEELIDIRKQLQNIHQLQPTPPSTSSDLVQVLKTVSENQQILAQALSQPAIQIQSTSDTARAISVFTGDPMQSAKDWITEVERIAAGAHWTHDLTMVNAQSRLSGSALNWNKTTGKIYTTWPPWKDALLSRFRRKLSMMEFIRKQSERTLLDSESITAYVYAKNALLELSPHPLSEEERISMIIGDIQEDRWATPLLANPSKSVNELIDKTIALDYRRKLKKDGYHQNGKAYLHKTSTHYGQHSNSHPRSSTQFSDYHNSSQPNNVGLHRFNPKAGDQISEQFCWRCGEKGHIMPQCTLPKPPKGTPIAQPRIKVDQQDSRTSQRSQQNRTMPVQQQQMVRRNQNSDTNQISCICNNSLHPTLIPVTINGQILNALVDNGSSVTLLHSHHVPPNSEILEWTDGNYRVAGGTMTPEGWLTAKITVGSHSTIMPRIGICNDLPVPMILGLDWQLLAQATVTTNHSGTISIITPTSYNTFHCEKLSEPVNCAVQPDSSVIKIETELQPEIEPSEQQIQDYYTKIVTEFSDVFSDSDENIGNFKDFELHINLSSNKPIACKPYRLSEPDRLFVKQHLDKWLKMGVCRPSNSAYAAPTFVVDQPFHSSTPRRVVIDYSRTINPLTIPDPHPIDRMDDLLNKISGKKYKTVLDIRQAYLNIRIREEDIHKTAMVTPDNHVEFTRVIFGLSGGPAIMSRVIRATFGHLFSRGVGTYFDDVAFGHNSFEEHQEVLKEVLLACRNKNLKIKPKFLFAALEINLLGRILTPSGERPDPERVSAVTRYNTLSSIHEIRSFLGFTNTFRKYVEGYANIARPLTLLLRKDKLQNNTSKNTQLVSLDTVQQQAFELLRKKISTPPILSYFRQGSPTFVETDASYTGLGACLSQEQDNARRIIEYASRGLTEVEGRYHINELECTAVHWALTQKFRLYLLGQKFTLITDNYSTAYIVNRAKLNRKFARYVIDLAQFEFTATHRPGKENSVADHLSRYRPPTSDNYLTQSCLAVFTTHNSQLFKAQRSDGFCQMILGKLESSIDDHHHAQIRKVFFIENKILMHISWNRGQTKKSIVIPHSLRSNVLKICHDDAGHFDTQKTIQRLKSSYWWKTLNSDAKAYVLGCVPCQHTNRRTVSASGLLGQRPLPNTPWECISADHLSLPETVSGNHHLLVHIDHATRYILARPTCTLAAADVCHTIEKDIIFQYGPPLYYISDNSTSFTSRTTVNFFAKYGIQHALTPPYNPQSNGLVERANATLIATIKKMIYDHPTQWDELIQNVLLNINTKVQSSAKFSPFYLLHGYSPHIPPDQLKIGIITNEESRENQLETLQHDRQMAIANISTVHQANKKRFDANKNTVLFEPGDQVLYSYPQANDNKLSPTFKGPYTVMSKVGDSCYRIKLSSGNTDKQNIRIVHVQALRKFHNRPDLDQPTSLFAENNNTDNPVQNTISEINNCNRKARNRTLPKHLLDYEL